MTKKLLAIIMAISMALSISACGSGKNNGESSTAEVTTTTSETTAEETTTSSVTTTVTSETTTEMKTIEPPADGWTPELLNQVMYLNGKPFSLPCTLKDLGEGYSFSEDFTYVGELLYNKEIVATVGITNYSDSEGLNNDSKINYIVFDRAMISDLKNGFDIKKCSINGVFLDSTKEEIAQRIGTANLNMTNDDCYYILKDKKRALIMFMFGLESEDSLDKIIIENF